MVILVEGVEMEVEWMFILETELVELRPCLAGWKQEVRKTVGSDSVPFHQWRLY